MGKKRQSLTGKQHRAVELLLSNNQVETAAALGVSARTVRAWLTLPHFQEALSRAQRGATTEAVLQLAGVMTAAVRRLGKLIDADKPEVQLGASRAALSAFPDLRRLTDLDERIAELERRLGNV